MMTNGDREGRIFLSHPPRNNGIIVLPTIAKQVLFFKKLADVPEYAEMRYDMMTSP